MLIRIGGTVLALAGIAACSGQSADQTASQIAAKVNGYEITVHQINFALGQLGAVPKEQIKTASNQVLERLIEQQVLIEQAIALKVDREPKTVQAIEAARRQILAQAYLERVAAGGSAVPDDTKRFYSEHPELFAERRIYRLQEINLTGDPSVLKPLQEQVRKAKSLNDVIAWMRTEKIPFATNMTTRAAEQMPMMLAREFHRLKQGQIAIVPNAGNITVSQIAAVQDAPLDIGQASPYIERFLDNQRRTGEIQQKLKELKAAAKIEYIGDFGAPGIAASVTGSPTDGGGAAAPGSPQPAPNKGEAFMEKGLSGLR
jgi:EpsD family peptidyl-prolyl cis-trans isomerase